MDRPRLSPASPMLFFDVPLHGPGVVHSDQDITRVIDRHGFSPTVAGCIGPLFDRGRIRNEGSDFTILHTADSDASFETWILCHVGFRIGDIEKVVLVDKNAARAAELLPLREEHAVRAEDPDTIIGS